MKSKIELLAPAGNYEGFLGAIHAGADAVYLGGNKFGARAYADNFSEEEICKAISYAHLRDRKVYLTVNTLLKNKEMQELIIYIAPFYQEGLDGVIVQDIGVFQLLKEAFPKLQLHASTQMSITGVYGARLLKEMGACRIVPARELSLAEIKNIKDEVDIEIETFIHGAMCYSYSGNCLFSSILGGRSGNRGRCAQPCRLPYEIMGTKNSKDTKRSRESITNYPLSLKDMCTVSILPELIQAGITSFKIEGRMKKPEYTAGVTAIYRKYIDSQGPITGKDEEILKALYIRSEVSEGYYKVHNHKDMITPGKPSYNGSEEALLSQIRKDYILKDDSLEIKGKIFCKVGEPVFLQVSYRDIMIEVSGNIVSEAQKQPLNKETLLKQLQKTGNSNFFFSDIEVTLEGSGFLPVKALNELRREAILRLEDKLLLKREWSDIPDVRITNNGKKDVLKDTDYHCLSPIVCVETISQLRAVLPYQQITCLYVNGDLFVTCKADIDALFKEKAFLGKQVFLSMPYIVRKRSGYFLTQLKNIVKEYELEGVLVRNLESFQWFVEQFGQEKKIVLDSNVSIFNEVTRDYWLERVHRCTASYECNKKELSQILNKRVELPVYGRIPLMLSANCIKNTTGITTESLKDRYQKHFPVVGNCNHCYNVIYNSIPLGWHSGILQLLEQKQAVPRLHFTIESGQETQLITESFLQRMEFPYEEYTKGHFNRGVE